MILVGIRVFFSVCYCYASSVCRPVSLGAYLVEKITLQYSLEWDKGGVMVTMQQFILTPADVLLCVWKFG